MCGSVSSFVGKCKSACYCVNAVCPCYVFFHIAVIVYLRLLGLHELPRAQKRFAHVREKILFHRESPSHPGRSLRLVGRELPS